MRILIVEDEVELCNTIAEGLSYSGYAVDTCYDGEEAISLAFIEEYDLIVLDLNLPGKDGLEVLKEIRSKKKELKILILSARGSVSHKVEGLDLGANDYLTKPFDFEELEARIRNLLRRRFIQEDCILRYQTLALDMGKKTVSVNNKPLMLTKKEFGILEYFLLHRDKVVSQEELMEHIWNMDSDSFSNSIRVHIASLRKKLKTVLPYELLETKIGEGYLLRKEEV